MDCKANIVDFTKSISKKYRPEIPKIISHYNFSLTSAVSLEEQRSLIDLGLCRTPDDEEKLLHSLFEKNDVSENIKYLRTGINGLFDIWGTKYSMMLTMTVGYGPISTVSYGTEQFYLTNTFYVKRAECYAEVIRKLKENNEDLA